MNPNLREDYKKTTDYTANFFHKHPDAVDKFYEKDINAIAKNTGLDRDIVDRDIQRTMKEIRLNTQDTLLEDTKIKGDIGGRATMQEGGSLLADDREQYSEGGMSLETLETLEALIAKGKIEVALKEEIKEEKDDSKKNNLQTLLERIQSGEIDATNIREDMGKKRGKKAEGGDIDNQMGSLMPTEEMHSMPDGTQMPGATHEEYEATMSTDEDMEDGYLDFILDEALEDEEETYLMEQLESNDKLSLIFDKVIDVATEFAGSGPVNGPGSGVSDSIPARLSDGEFVFTAKATEELGADNLEAIMREAEVQAEGRQQAAIGGYINVDRDDDTQIPIQTTESAKAQSNVQPVNRRKTVEQLEEEMLKSNPRRRYAVISG